MKKNAGVSDRIIRFVLVDFLLGFSYLGFEIPDLLANAAFITCLIIAVPIIFGYSLIYQLLGISTIAKEDMKGLAST